MMETFSDFKRNFYSRVTDLGLLDCGDINLLKVVLDGLKVNYIKKGKVRAFLFYSRPLFYLYCFIKRKRNNSVDRAERYKFKLQKLKDRKIIINDAGRFVTDSAGKTRSVYFDTIVSEFGRDQVVVIVDKLMDKELDI